MPYEFVALILNRLTIPQILFCLPKVCRQFKEMCLNYNYRESSVLVDGRGLDGSISEFLNQLKQITDFIYMERHVNPNFDLSLPSDEIVIYFIKINVIPSKIRNKSIR